MNLEYFTTKCNVYDEKKMLLLFILNIINKLKLFSDDHLCHCSSTFLIPWSAPQRITLREVCGL